jgi:hypothetical protein
MPRVMEQVKIGDLVRSKNDPEFYGFVTYIDIIPETRDFYVEVMYDVDADPVYFYEDQLEIIKLYRE